MASSSMDVVQHCLNLTPVTYLSLAFDIFRSICSSINQVQASKQQLRVLATCLSQLLITLNAEYEPGNRSLSSATAATLSNLVGLLREILNFVQKQASYNLFKQLFTKDERLARIEEYRRRLGFMVETFQLSVRINTQDWQWAQDADQSHLYARLADLEANQPKLVDALNTQKIGISPLMVSLQRRLDGDTGVEQERRFYSHTLRYLQTSSRQHVQFESWMITFLDVEFGPSIGVGGFAQVFQGKWNMTDVALKVFKTEGGVLPSPAAIRREIDTWSKLWHPHILQFLGANILDDKPFIVMPFLKSGNVRDYIHSNPNCSRQKILYHIALGLVYLHSRNIVHGDLKALNVLIDDGEKAVLCDFGLSRIKADVTSRTPKANAGTMMGSRNWMAPERLMGGLPRKQADVYSFGLMIYEIHTNEIPLGHYSYLELVTLVVDRNVRPEHPDEHEAPQITDDTWSLAERCWVKDPRARPNINTVCNTMCCLLEAGEPMGVTERTQESETMNWTRDSDQGHERIGRFGSGDFGSYSRPSSSTRHDHARDWARDSDQRQRHEPTGRFDGADFGRYSQPSSSTRHDQENEKRDWARDSDQRHKHVGQLDGADLGRHSRPSSSTRHDEESEKRHWARDSDQRHERGQFDGTDFRGRSPPPSPSTRHDDRHNKYSKESYHRDYRYGGGSARPERPEPLSRSRASDYDSDLAPLSGFRLPAPPPSPAPDPMLTPRPTRYVSEAESQPPSAPIVFGSVRDLITDREAEEARETEAAQVRRQRRTERLAKLSIPPIATTYPFPPISSSSFRATPEPARSTGSAESSSSILQDRYPAGRPSSPPIQSSSSGSAEGPPPYSDLGLSEIPRSAKLARRATYPLSRGNFNEVFLLKGHADSVDCVAFSPDGKRIASGSHDKVILVWDSVTGAVVLGPLKGHTSAINSVTFSYDGQKLASGSSDTTLMVWDAFKGTSLFRPMRGHKEWISVVAFSPDDAIVASGSNDGTTLVWDATTGDRKHTLTTDQRGMRSIAFCPDSMHFMSAAAWHSIWIHVWDAHTWELVRVTETPKTKDLWSSAFSPDCKRIVSTAEANEICIWDTTTGELAVGPWRWHTGLIRSVAFSHDGKWIASGGSGDKTVCLWNAANGRSITDPLKTSHGVRALAISPDKTKIVCGHHYSSDISVYYR